MVVKRIILVDDDPYVTSILAAKLRKAGYEVAIAENGEEGLALASAQPPDAMITDYQMPIMSGYEMSMKLKEHPTTSNVPLLMLTARGHDLSLEQLARTSIRSVFAKPFSATELVAKIDELLGMQEPAGNA